MTLKDTPVIGMILKGYPRISETFISNEILLLERAGFRLHLFSMRDPRENFCHDSVRRIGAGVDYLPQTIEGNVRRLAAANLRLALTRPQAYRRALGLAVQRYGRTRKSATFRHLLQAGYLVDRLLPGKGITHLHAHFAHSPTSVALFASVLSGLPFSFTGHAKDIYTSDPRQLAEKIDRATFVVTCTDYNRRHLEQLASAGRTPIYRVYHGIDLALFSGSNGRELPKPPYRLMTVARLTPKKGLPDVLLAVRMLKDQGYDLRHVLIGDGDDRDLILSLIRELGLSGVTEWLGTQEHSVVLEHYRQAHLFLLGCRVAENGDRDGIPNVFMESMAMGAPVVATSISAIPELIQDRETGLLVPPGRPDQLARAAIRLLTDHDLRQKIILQAEARVRRDFDNQELVQSLADVYRRHMG